MSTVVDVVVDVVAGAVLEGHLEAAPHVGTGVGKGVGTGVGTGVGAVRSDLLEVVPPLLDGDPARPGALLVALREDALGDDRLHRRERLLHQLALERQRRARRRSA